MKKNFNAHSKGMAQGMPKGMGKGAPGRAASPAMGKKPGGYRI